MSLVRIYLFIGLVLGLCTKGISQADTSRAILEDQGVQDIVEDFVSRGEGEEEFDFNTLTENLEYRKKHPLDLNSATDQELRELGLLNEIQINNLITYRRELGDLIAIYELQSISGFNVNLIKRISPFVAVGGSPFDNQVPILTMMAKGQNDLFFRWAKGLQTKKGFTDPVLPTDQRYLGNDQKYYVRFKHSFENRLSYGFTAEKDPGEPFADTLNKYGFDFYSFHFYIKDLSKKIKSIAIGDFNASMGQGLIMHSGFGGGKSSFVMNIKRGGRTVIPYTSIAESNFLRGVGITIAPFKKIETSLFVSRVNKDANIFIDTTQFISDEEVFTSLQISGFHRTKAEFLDKGSIQQTNMGANINYKDKNFKIGLNGLYTKFNRPFNRSPQIYNQFYFSGDELLNASVDYTYFYKNLHFFGETAVSDFKNFATVNGLMVSLDRKAELAFFHRYIPRDYSAVNSNIFAETGQGNNENGLYVGLEVRPTKGWKISSYFDFWSHPWLRFQIDQPSNGREFFTRLTYTVKRKMEAYIQVRYEEKAKNLVSEDIHISNIASHQRTQLRLHVSNKISKELELRNRAEFHLFKFPGQKDSKGFLIYQDVIYKPVGVPIQFSTRLALFDTYDYNSRIYAYENDLLYNFSVPALYNRGTRFYLNVRYTGIRNLSIEGRYSITSYSNVETIGSGLEEIKGSKRSEIKAQLKYSF
jgi:hypothetical protein